MLKPPAKTLPDAMRLGRALIEKGAPVTSAEMPALVGLKVGGSTNTLRRAAREFSLIESTPKGFVATPLMARLANETFDPADLLTALLGPPSYRMALARFGPDPSIASFEDLTVLFAEYGAGGKESAALGRIFLQSVGFARKSGVALEDVDLSRELDVKAAGSPISLPPRASRRLESGFRREENDRLCELRAEAHGKPFVEHELVRAILSLAPAVGSDWPADRREAFLDMMRGALMSLYPRVDPDTSEPMTRFRAVERR